MLYQFPLFDETLHHMELCNSVICQNREIRQNCSNIVYWKYFYICSQALRKKELMVELLNGQHAPQPNTYEANECVPAIAK